MCVRFYARISLIFAIAVLLFIALGIHAVCAGEPEMKDGQVTRPLGGPLRASVQQSQNALVFVNGQRTRAGDAMSQATATGDALQCGCRLIFHDGTLPV